MDTMQLDLIFKKGVEFSRKDEERIRERLDGLKSPLGYTYCDVLKEISYKDEAKVIVKLSYPRFYYENNAYLITTYEECKKVQKYFVKQLQEDDLLKKIKSIRVTRVDIPFTYMMKEEKEFHDYSNVYKMFAFAFAQKYEDVEAKSIVDTIKKREQTVIYTDSPSISAYNTKITIYNQMKNLEAKYSEDKKGIKKTLEDYPDLPRRMRIEMSKRINRKEMALKEFKKYELFEEYAKKYKKELNKLMFNEELIDEVCDQEVEVLAELLKKYKKKKKKKFTYEAFIYKYQEEIYDYGVLKDAIEEVISNRKTKEAAITKIRRTLRELEEDQGKIIIGVRKTIKGIRETIKKSFKEKKKKGNKVDKFEECPF